MWVFKTQTNCFHDYFSPPDNSVCLKLFLNQNMCCGYSREPSPKTLKMEPKTLKKDSLLMPGFLILIQNALSLLSASSWLVKQAPISVQSRWGPLTPFLIKWPLAKARVGHL